MRGFLHSEPEKAQRNDSTRLGARPGLTERVHTTENTIAVQSFVYLAQFPYVLLYSVVKTCSPIDGKNSKIFERTIDENIDGRKSHISAITVLLLLHHHSPSIRRIADKRPDKIQREDK